MDIVLEVKEVIDVRGVIEVEFNNIKVVMNELMVQYEWVIVEL